MRNAYALFDTVDAATAAYQEICARGEPSERCSAMVHVHELDESVLPATERAGLEGARKGAVVAGVAGALIGAAAAFGGAQLGVGPLAAAAVGGGVMAAYGAFVGGITRADEPASELRALAEELHRGKALVAVESDSKRLQQVCADVFRAHGGQLVVA